MPLDKPFLATDPVTQASGGHRDRLVLARLSERQWRRPFGPLEVAPEAEPGHVTSGQAPPRKLRFHARTGTTRGAQVASGAAVYQAIPMAHAQLLGLRTLLGRQPREGALLPTTQGLYGRGWGIGTQR